MWIFDQPNQEGKNKAGGCKTTLFIPGFAYPSHLNLYTGDFDDPMHQ
jgi:hypothetical protein